MSPLRRTAPNKLLSAIVGASLLLASISCERRTAPSAVTRPAPPSADPASPSLAASRTKADSSASGEPLMVPAAQIHQPLDTQPGQRRPLLLFLHGLGSSGRAAFEGLHLAEFAARKGIFLIAPDGSPDRQNRRFWNAGAACCNFDRRDIDDVARIAGLIDTWRARSDVDGSRIYVIGHSNGGFMTERLVCALGDRIAAAASLAGAAPPADQHCIPTKTLALLSVHGDSDEIVRYAGGTVFDTAELSPFPGAEQGFRDWARRLGCSGAPRSAPDLDLEPGLPGPETRVSSFPNCASGSVELWTVRGGDHSVGMGTQALDAIWQFLAAHHS